MYMIIGGENHPPRRFAIVVDNMDADVVVVVDDDNDNDDDSDDDNDDDYDYYGDEYDDYDYHDDCDDCHDDYDYDDCADDCADGDLDGGNDGRSDHSTQESGQCFFYLFTTILATSRRGTVVTLENEKGTEWRLGYRWTLSRLSRALTPYLRDLKP